MSIKRQLRFVLGMLAIAVIVLSGCATPAVPTVSDAGAGGETVSAEKVLRINLGTFPDMIDPQRSSFVNEIALLKLAYEGLTRQDAELDTVPAAAESWTYNDDATVLTFTLRDGLKYSDGSLLNAERFAYSIRRNIDPATAGEYASITDEILGAPEWRGCGDDAAACEAAKAQVMESVKATHADGSACTGYDDAECNTLTLTLSRPAPYFHVVMSLWVTFPAKEELITAAGENWWLDAANHVGNGPFIMDTLEQGVRAFYTPNPNYWGQVPVVSIDFAFITDSAVAFEAYKNNEFDIIGLAAEDLEVVKADPVLSQEANIYPGSCSFAVMFHQLKEPFTDQKVREAFAHALDRDAWVQDVLRGLGSPTLTWIPKGFPGYDAEENRWGYDPEAALQAIADSSYGSVENLPPITLTFSDTPRNRTRNEWLAAKFKEVLGIDVKLDPVEATTYTALTKDINTAPQTFILGWCADYPDPQNWLSVYWRTGAFGERIGYSNPELDALLEQADTELDPEKRAQLYADAQRLLTDGAPVAFMWNNVNAYLVKPWVSGIVKTPQDAGWPGDISPWTIDIDTAAQIR
ncbi:MAG: ABC transporter substrate-binding protein [Chloroflexota bacterium]|jgi:oligopeptide transport system substrate-binding protein|nr:peptide ABC transporter substrate-binding protein [Caldilinea sp.]GIK76073.1 MAG: ABC transporter substrate-binding protein [Chloroflexota bacterium]